MIIDGKAIANDIKETLKKEIKEREAPPMLFIVSVGENPVSEKFLSIKKKFASDTGVPIIEKKFNDISTAELSKEISKLVLKKDCGIIVQLPLPKDIEKQKVLNTIPPTYDIDVLSGKSFELYKKGTLPILPPVIAAIKEILFRHNIFVGNKNVVIVGKGRLVGEPAAIWFERHQSNIHIIDTKTKDPKALLQNADIIVSGAGRPHFIKPDMIKEGVVLLDAGTSTELSTGTSETSRKLTGDIDPSCAKKALLFSPVPGGIGPVTVAMLFTNLLVLTKK